LCNTFAATTAAAAATRPDISFHWPAILSVGRETAFLLPGQLPNLKNSLRCCRCCLLQHSISSCGCHTIFISFAAGGWNLGKRLSYGQMGPTICCAFSAFLLQSLTVFLSVIAVFFAQ